MRERKFRGQKLDGNDWYEGYYWYSAQSDRHYIRVNINNELRMDFPVKPETVGQYTGLKDKNGKERNIYGADILESKDGLRRYVVTWDDRNAKWYLKGIGKAWCDSNPNWDEYKETGMNIHESPDLMEKAK